MPKHDKSLSDQARIKLRYLECDIDAANDTVIEGFKQLTAAIARGNGGAQRTIMKLANGATPKLATPEDQHELEEDNDSEQEGIATPNPRERRSTGTTRVQKLSVLPLDFKKASLPLKEFVKDLELDGVMKKFTAVAAWYAEHFTTPSVTADHIYTAFKHLGWTDMPKKPSTVLADLKNKNSYKWFDGGQNTGEFNINHIGLQKVAEWRQGHDAS